MDAFAALRARVDAAMAVDEIGIESGGYGLYRLKCLYQPVFERRRQSLRLVAVEATTRPHVAGEEVPAEVFLEAVAADDLGFIDHLALAIAVRNYATLESGDMSLLVDLPSSLDTAKTLLFMSLEAETVELETSRIICTVSEAIAPTGTGLSTLAIEIRGKGMGVAIADFGSGRWSDGQMDFLAPDIVRINGDWFRKICRDPMTIRLFDTVVARLRERNARVLVSGIETEQHLGVALRAGADLFAGRHLAPAALAGSSLVESVSLRDKLGGAEKIVPLYG
ncbi:MAG: EAL domain-containing protein [Rhizobiaceae bacterium]|nr:EAL domain-containing protein [Rhizobiaceae bacterium]